MPSPKVSLYKLTLPPVMGVPSATQASLMPSIACESCHMISGFSGLPKFRQLVAATGVAPVQATLRAASVTACMAPNLGSSQHQSPLQSSDMARARFVPLTRIRPPSPPGPSTVLVCTMLSYCSWIQRLEQMLGEASRVFRAEVRSPPAASLTSAGTERGTLACHGFIGR